MAWKAVADSGAGKGLTVVIQGAAGGVGLFAVQFATMRGARVIGTLKDIVELLAAKTIHGEVGRIFPLKQAGCPRPEPDGPRRRRAAVKHRSPKHSISTPLRVR